MATCKGCLHNEACKAVLDAAGFFSDDIEEILNAIKCPNFADKSRFEELPCKVGDTVYQIDAERVYEYKVTNIVYETPTISFDKRAIGNGSLFLTREEAEAALAERRDK